MKEMQGNETLPELEQILNENTAEMSALKSDYNSVQSEINQEIAKQYAVIFENAKGKVDTQGIK